jgi:hypothetical protein
METDPDVGSWVTQQLTGQLAYNALKSKEPHGRHARVLARVFVLRRFF